MGILQMTPFLWTSQSRYYSTNSGILMRDGNAILIDPGMTMVEREQIRWFISTRGWKIKTILLTHAHWDHILGAGDYPEMEIITQTGFTPFLEEHIQDTRRIIADLEKEEGKKSAGWRPPRPTITFTERMQMILGEMNITLWSVPGHTSDQFAIYLPDEHLLWAADMLSVIEIPSVSYNLSAYRETLQTLSALDIEQIYPGHGSPALTGTTSRERFTQDQSYLEEIYNLVDESVKEGLTIEETVQKCAVIPYRNPEENTVCHKRNVESAFLELGGKTAPGVYGWNQEWLG